MKKTFGTFAAFLFLTVNTFAQEHSTHSSQPVSGAEIEKQIIKWIPTAGPIRRASRDECELEYYMPEFRQALKHSPRAAEANFQDRYELCSSEWKRSESTYWSILRGSGIQYDFLSHPRIERLTFNLPGDRTLNGVLALQHDRFQRPGPLVIIQCGLHCDIQSPSLRDPLMHLFDEGPFHVLVLESLTATNFQRNNGFISAGGIDEGRQLYWIAQSIRNGNFPWSDRVSEIHLAGLSLGGHSTLYASIYDSHSLRPSIDSYFAGCSPIDLKTSTQSLYGVGQVPALMVNTFRNNLHEVHPFVSMLRNLIPSRNDTRRLPREEAPGLVAELATSAYNDFVTQTDLTLAPFTELGRLNAGEFWDANNLLNYAHLISGPALLFTSHDDPVVRTHENFSPLRERLQELNREDIAMIATDFGGHCNYGVSNDWQLYGNLLRNFFIHNSPSLQHRNSERFSTINPLRGDPIGEFVAKANEHFEHYEWTVDRSKKEATLSVRFRRNTLFNRFRNIDLVIALSEMAENKSTEFQPQDPEASSEQLTRWLNSNLQVMSSKDTIFDGSQIPSYIRWSAWER